MDIIEKVFKQYPFIYKVGGQYYAFGTGVCTICDNSSALLDAHYKKYVETIDNNLSSVDAWKIFYKIICEANYFRDKNGISVYPKKEFVKLDFNDEDIKELELQVLKYIDVWKKYGFKHI